jgi:hypothetical protein
MLWWRAEDAIQADRPDRVRALPELAAQCRVQVQGLGPRA